MSTFPFRPGDFVWCAFPESERPSVPGPRHVAYVISIVRHPDQQLSALLAYTTTRDWPSEGRPPGVYVFDADGARDAGQARPFVLDARRVAYVPITAAWFPDLDKPPQRGRLGSIPSRLKDEINAVIVVLLQSQPPVAERLGPLWPRA